MSDGAADAASNLEGVLSWWRPPLGRLLGRWPARAEELRELLDGGLLISESYAGAMAVSTVASQLFMAIGVEDSKDKLVIYSARAA